MNAANRTTASSRITRTLRALGLAAAVALAVPAHAQECSGGSAGGTDATGNQCNASLDAAPPALASSPDTGAATKAPAASLAAGSPPPMKAAAQRKKVFDERRARFEGAGHPRVAAAPGLAASSPRSAP